MPERARHPADAIIYYTRLIVEEERKIQESLAAIAEYSALLARVTEDTGRRMLTRD